MNFQVNQKELQASQYYHADGRPCCILGHFAKQVHAQEPLSEIPNNLSVVWTLDLMNRFPALDTAVWCRIAFCNDEKKFDELPLLFEKIGVRLTLTK